MKWKVWLRTFTSAIVCSISGIWQATHSLPVLPGFVMRVRFDGSRMRPVLRVCAVAHQAYLVHWLAQHRVILAAMRVMATEAGHASGIHQALHEIISLHPVLVRRTIGKMREGKIAELCGLQASSSRQVSDPYGIRPANRNSGRQSDSFTGLPCEWHWMQVSFAERNSSAQD